ncbi:hypothetical protein HII31_01615 [Pseudocercospora fuligena]|uniref:Uncharacterized protein n=1 Tax=Pseudocercospora fuligena TaxID=685502 RepID=A0A8H6RSM0_9PEZI|nr:hypothetical protein HII31_01615 [Pseudocercospora fuligena]
MERRVRLLVHAGAPSNRQDDEHRAAQAAAYLGLRSMSVAKLISFRASNNAQEHPTTGQQPQSATAARIVAVTPLPEHDEYVEDTQLAYTALETQLFTSSGRSKSSPTPKKATDHRQRVAPTHLQYTSANKEEPPPVIDHCNKRRRVDKLKARQDDSSGGVPRTPIIRRTASDLGSTVNAVQHVFNGPESQSSYLPSPALIRRSKHIHDEGNPRSGGQRGGNNAGPSRSRAEVDLASVWMIRKPGPTDQTGDSGNGTITTSETTSDLPTSYSLSDGAADSGKDQAQALHRGTADGVSRDHAGHTELDKNPNLEMTVASAMSSKTVVIAGPSRPHMHSTADSQEARTNMNNLSPQESKNDCDETTSSRCVSALASVLPVVEPAHLQTKAREALLSSAIEIRAPLPLTSIQSFETHITKMLVNLAEDTEFQALYRPNSISRPLETHERGYWLIEWSQWPATHQLDFWRQLETLIGNGSVGWGIWCTRVQDVRCNENANAGRTSHCKARKSVSVWCWGEVVQHVYLLLYTVSMGRVRKLGLKWIDSTGVAVVQMQGSSNG